MEHLEQVLISGIFAGMVYGLISIGLSLIWGIMDMVNFAHSDFMMLAMYFTWLLFSRLGLDPLISLPVVFIVMFCLGAGVYFLVIRRVIGGELVQQTLCTFGLVVLLQSVAQYLWTGNYRMINDPLVSGNIHIFSASLSRGQVIAGVASLFLAGAIWWIVQKTETGWALMATAQNRHSAPLVGIRVDRMFALAWGIGLGSVGAAGVFLANYYYIYPQVGTTFQLLALVAVALGGFGSIPGAIAAGIAVGIIEALSGYLIEPAYKYLVVFSLYIVVVLVRPHGLLGTHS
ncbi:MAG: branched-chain amino acid ABC transporter permease [Synergistaceae bacterium]|jgi:branched-chain amino acid transport system permease protein|nr:branched-chain amino acid ABC transporter permease [Synergistaceae bacterium]